ncbi:4Fe-4S dicluster domain-containing protein [Mangrovibacterium lignilyticum]|uniref:4Fe-4S dicluster domain-containing protein n=1 Tax=Mangrovibacterium lignilyticum TaxID=2668052 RepID=UPI0013D2B07D|nr:4Fe-4S dicluster domain-containing protein [Mangrovibacterium lignilyticum]
MAIPTSRTKHTGVIHVDDEKCNQCGLCVSICKDGSLVMKGGRVTLGSDPVFGCYGCGHCMAICPESAVEIEGRELSLDDLLPLPDASRKTLFDDLYQLMLGCRSIRDFKKKEIEPHLIDQIIEAALTAPVVLPPSDVKLLVFKGRAKVREFAFDAIDQMAKSRWLIKPPGIWLWKMAGNEAYELMKGFGFPLINKLV